MSERWACISDRESTLDMCRQGLAPVTFRLFVRLSSRMGRLLPTAGVGCPVAQLGGLLSGDEIARPTGAGRPKPVRHNA
jgi:hypothetical protein